MFITLLNFVNMMGSVKQFMYQKFVHIVLTLVFSVSAYLLPLLGVIRTYFFRGSLRNNELISEASHQKDPISNAPEPVCEVTQDSFSFKQIENDDFGENETPKFSFKFKCPSFEEFIGEPELLTFGGDEVVEGGFLSEIDFKQVNSEAEFVRDEIQENATYSARLEEEVPTTIEARTIVEARRKQNDAGGNLLDDQDEVHSEKDSFILESDSNSTSLSHKRSVMADLVDSYSDGFLSDGDFGGKFESHTSMDIDGDKEVPYNEMPGMEEDHESNKFDEEDGDIMKEFKKLEEVQLNVSNTSKSQFLSEKDFHEEMEKSKNGSDNSEKLESENSSVLDSDDSYKLETLWEHQELIEQLKMELNKVRATGLPTILEESDSPKMEDLKPWKIDEEFQLEDCLGELHEFYKSYAERMRKFDILNYQKMYAIGFLQLNDPLQSITSQRSSVPAFTSLLSQNFSPYRKKKAESDPMMKFIKELQSDLEVVYVGQMCLSWEILYWQYEKALDLWESDPHGIHQYNEVAGEFQQFQVLLQRFIEDESFQGPRVLNYVKNRCVLRNLLQIPLIREDCSKDKKKAIIKETGEHDITSDMLVEIIEESIRTFWHFVRADKDCTNVIVKPLEHQDPVDSKLFSEVQRNLQKKERKLKYFLRSGNCILRRFRKCQEDNSDQVLFFFSQADMKLVSRVLNMSRITTDQLVWCRNKLSKISFVNRKIHVESSFFLFPC